MRNGIARVIPEGPGVGPDSTLPHGGRGGHRSRTLALKVGASASISDGGSTRHNEYDEFSGLGWKVLWKDGELRPTNGKTYILGPGINQDTYRGPSITLICPGATSVSSFSHGP
jgi:hypothetical protein